MADSLPTLIKLAAYKVEQAQQALAFAQRTEEDAYQTLLNWQQAGPRGYQTAFSGDDINHITNAGTFLKKAKEEEEKARITHKQRQKETEAARQILSVAFAGQKRYELLHQKHLQLARKTLQKKQQAALEDVTSQKRG